MLRKRRKSGKKDKRGDIPKASGITVPGSISEPHFVYPDADIVLDYSKLIRQGVPKSKQNKQSNIKQRHITELLDNYEKLYRSFRAPIGVLDSFHQLIEDAQKDKKIEAKPLNILSAMINSVQAELLNIENILVYLLLVWAVDLPKTTINLLSAVERELSISAKSLKAGKIKIQIDVDPSLGIKCPPELFGLCLRNILANIIESAKSKTELLIRTKVSQFRPKSIIDLSFIHPFEKENPIEIGKVFDLFYSDKPSNLGIGLTLCRVILENIGGEISLEPLPAHKIATILRLPLYKGG